jgi:delta24(24(1))-sterol reductase
MYRSPSGPPRPELTSLAHDQNYTADWIQALTWGLSAGLNTPITFFYPAFFMTVLIHRCGRDFERCARKYGDE